MALQYSSMAIIAPFNGGRALMFRIANRRRNELIEMQAQLTLAIHDTTAASAGRRYFGLTLDRSAVNFFPLAWTLVHPITPESPLWGVSAADLAARDAEVLAMLHGTDETFATRVSTRRSYRHDELIWGAKFRSIFDLTRADGRIAIDLTKLDLYDRAELPPPDAIPAAS
jgi:inward rectifier potassium channel